MKPKPLAEQILRQYVGINLNELTRLEQNIMDIVCRESGYLMPTNSYATFIGPVKYEICE